ncbi:MAG: prepilin-type N-terminal cleavage/methylation domain-containing protein [Verrucomicrobia bacterium]|nr:prepilin-type N-terminal cleavage/methylation domain-containing protein [Verrucomicrobiota bacterium]MCH8512347.1 prepilin-type N-terminal cleavage/methylation domain-containing protein [Kiritimatiellia bacterium]
MNDNFHTQRKANTRGFTLVEVMVSSVILALFLSGALAMLVQTTRTTESVRRRSEAVSLAWSRVERARLVDFNNLEDLVEKAPGTVVNAVGLMEENGLFRRVTSVAPLPGEMPAMQIRVDVWVRNTRDGAFSGVPETVETVITNIPRSWTE